MSGRPNFVDAFELREVLRRIQSIQSDLHRAREIIATETAVVSGQTERLESSQARARELLAKMDCGPDGNAGSEHRQLALLGLLISLPERVP